MFGEWIRRNGFWTLDFVRGSRVRKHLVDIREIMENVDSPSSIDRQNRYLADILGYAAENVPFTGVFLVRHYRICQL